MFRWSILLKVSEGLVIAKKGRAWFYVVAKGGFFGSTVVTERDEIKLQKNKNGKKLGVKLE